MRTYSVLISVSFFVGVAIAVSACTALTSETLQELTKEGAAPEGVSYSLPKGVVDLILSVDPRKAVFTLTVDGPRYIPDHLQSYYLRYRPLPNYQDKISVETNNRAFLKAVRASTTDQTPGIIVNVAKALSVVGALEASPVPESSAQLAKVTFDPLSVPDRNAAINDLNNHIRAYINGANNACRYYAGGVSLSARHTNELPLHLDDGKEKDRIAVDGKDPKPTQFSPGDKALLYYDYMTYSYRRLNNKLPEGLSDKEKQDFYKDDKNWDPPVNLRKELRAIETRKQIVDAQITQILKDVGKADQSLRPDFKCDVEIPDRYPPDVLNGPSVIPKNGNGVTDAPKLPSSNAASSATEPAKKTPDEYGQRLCGLLLDQKMTESLRVKLQTKIDDLDQKAKDIEQARKDQKDYCDKYQAFIVKSKAKEAKTPDPDEQQDVTLIAALSVVPFVDPEMGRADTRTNWAASAVDCSVGICYRPKVPYRLRYGLINDPDARGPDGSKEFSLGKNAIVSMDTATVELPNEEALVTIDIRRAFFVNKVQNIAFDDDGFLTNVEINKPSELVAMSKLPLDVISAVADGLKIRVDLATQQKNLLQREAALLSAQAKLRDTRSQLETAPAVRSVSSLEASPVRPAGAPPSASSLDYPP